MLKFLNRINWQSPLIIVFFFLLVVSVRFNRNDLLVKRNLADAAFYIGNVEFLRGERISYGLQAPFNERILVTLLAAPLPFSPMTSINIVNVAFLLLSIFYLSKTLELFNLDKKMIYTGLYLFIFSFPTFYYATIGYVDSGVLFAVFLGTYAIYKDNYGLFLLAVATGTLAKEGAVLLIPVAIAHAFSSGNRRWYFYALLGLITYFVIWGAVKYYVPSNRGNTPLLFWQPSNWRIRSNLTRLNFYLSSLLSFGIPGLLAILMLVKKYSFIIADWKKDLPLWAGATGGGLLWFYTLFSAYTDGRFFWISCCFPIILSMVWWKRYSSPFCFSNSLQLLQNRVK